MFDGKLPFGVIAICILIYEEINNPMFTTFDLFLINIQQFLVSMGVFTFIYALQNGKAGPAQSIQESKTIL
jgi:hypothetical protein